MENLQEEIIDGIYTVNTGISTDEWIKILKDEKLMRSTYKETLLKFYKEPEHKSTCKNLSDKYGRLPQSYTSIITHFGRAVQRKLNRFRIIGVDGKETFWSIIMLGKIVGSNFEWTIKPELVEAIEKSGIVFDPITEMINHYKEHVKSGGMKDELYKWELVQKFKGKPDLNSENFAEEIKSIEISNLAYRMTKAVVNDIANRNPLKYRELFVNLFDEKILLNDRVKAFIDGVKQLYSSLGETLSPHHNERAIATFLTYHNPDKYTFFMPTYYDSYCNNLGINTRSVGEKYGHYLELIDDLIENYILEDKELLDLIDTELNKGNYYPDKKRKILAQDILRFSQKTEKSNIHKNTIIANITWSSSDWKEPSKDVSGHEWVKRGGIPHESWNFDFDNQRNPEGKILGFAKFTNAPTKLKDSGNLVVFFSRNKIVGFYGGAEILPKTIDISETESYNIIGTRNLSVLLQNKIDNAIEEGYLEGKKRVGQGGFNYLKKNETVLDIIERAIELNPNQEKELRILSDWFLGEENQQTNQAVNIKNDVLTKTQPLNQILYGPPGTGKTYNTINKALEIIAPGFTNGKSRSEIKQEYNKLVERGQIVFTTFHQSMNYEDFVEGIKPQKPSDGDSFLQYDIEPGIFKIACNNAKSIKRNTINVDWDKPKYYKMSLGGKDRQDIHEWCINNNLIALGWGNDKNLTELAGIKSWSDYSKKFNELFPDLIEKSKFHAQATYAFINMKINDIVVVSMGNKIIDAVGIIKGNYYWDDNNPIDYYHFRKVEWIAKDLNVNPERFFNKKISQMTIYEFYDEDVKRDAFKEITGQLPEASSKPYVLIIDEINRGNISQIFGELITLIEEDKRMGNSEALEITLPYSKEKFGVPANLYIIGTMNTADRSVEALDTALRRRFSFEEIKSNPELIIEFGNAENGIIEGVNLVKLLETLNKRIEVLLDRDHQIGHSYFLHVANLEMLKGVFQNKIIPLLQEYFFGDYGKIGLTLGNGFVESSSPESDDKFFAPFTSEYSSSEYFERPIYNIHNPLKMSDEQFLSALKILMNE